MGGPDDLMLVTTLSNFSSGYDARHRNVLQKTQGKDRMTTTREFNAPVNLKDRIVSLDVLRGLALTNYLIQTIICTFIFYGHGLGYFGSVDRRGQIVIVIIIWLFQLVSSSLWLSRFRFGPAEWLWRSLTYWRVQPFRKMIK